MTEVSTGETLPVCSTACDPDYDAVCHEDHAAGHKKKHWPYDCPAADRYGWGGDQFTADAIKRLRGERDTANERAKAAEGALKEMRGQVADHLRRRAHDAAVVDVDGYNCTEAATLMTAARYVETGEWKATNNA